MISWIFVLSLVACAFAQPPYSDSADAIEAAIEQLEEQILSMEGNVPNITDSRRHYAVLLTHIAQVANEIAESCIFDYEETYIDLLPSSIAIALTHVNKVIDVTKDSLKSLDNETRKIQSLMETLCPKGTWGDVCDQIIDQSVRGDFKRYQHEADILITAGSVATQLLEANLIGVADDHDEIDYLLVNMEELESLITTLADLIRIVANNYRCS